MSQEKRFFYGTLSGVLYLVAERSISTSLITIEVKWQETQIIPIGHLL